MDASPCTRASIRNVNPQLDNLFFLLGRFISDAWKFIEDAPRLNVLFFPFLPSGWLLSTTTLGEDMRATRDGVEGIKSDIRRSISTKLFSTCDTYRSLSCLLPAMSDVCRNNPFCKDHLINYTNVFTYLAYQRPHFRYFNSHIILSSAQILIIIYKDYI